MQMQFRSRSRSRSAFGLALAASLTASGAASAATFGAVEDRWMYPFAGSGGTTNRAPTFGADSLPTFDQRDGQFLVEFDTSGTFASGAGASNYVINSARLEVSVVDGAFEYDGTYDAYTTYFGGPDPDTDTGRPAELYGIGYRNGNSTTGTNLETVGFSPPGPPSASVRNAYASDFLGGADRDVSNNVDGGFDPNPFAVGTTGLADGAVVPAGTTYGFDFVLGVDVVAYLQDRLNQGRVDLAVTSMHASTFGGAATYPGWATRENVSVPTPKLILDVTVIPEPGTALLASMGLVGLGAFGRARVRA